MSQCEVKGLGKLPCSFSTKFDGLNFENAKDANGHNENRVNLSCSSEPIYAIDDEITIHGGKQPGTGEYTLTIEFNSEVNVGLFKDGKVYLDYNASKNEWDMSAIRDGEPWKFCDAFSVVKVIENALRCYAMSDQAKEEGFDFAVNMLLTSISSQASHIDQTSAQYTDREDCIFVPKRANIEAYPGGEGAQALD